MKNLLLVFSGPSGVGKGTVLKKLLNDGNFRLSVSCTTREKREGEKDGVSYFFIEKPEFEKMIKEDGFLEYNRHFENYYGTPKKFVTESLKTGDVVLEIEVDGALKVKAAYPQAVLIMLLPPDRKELEKRLIHRGSESAEKIAERVQRMDYELSKRQYYDYTVINDDLNECVARIKEIIKKEKEIRQ